MADFLENIHYEKSTDNITKITINRPVTAKEDDPVSTGKYTFDRQHAGMFIAGNKRVLLEPKRYVIWRLCAAYIAERAGLSVHAMVAGLGGDCTCCDRHTVRSDWRSRFMAGTP